VRKGRDLLKYTQKLALRAVPARAGSVVDRVLPALDQAAAEVRFLPAVRVFEIRRCVLITNKIVPIELAPLIVFEDRPLPAPRRHRRDTQDNGQARSSAPASRSHGPADRPAGARREQIASDGGESSHA